MTTEKQLLANQQNALLSTGPTSVEGKAVISTNAIKHGIFTKDLILNSEHGEEEKDYKELLNNLIENLIPSNQLENLLVEKIAVDFWRLRRTIRFETGSIVDGISSLQRQHYSNGASNNEKIDEQIEHNQQTIEWNRSYLENLAKGNVIFDKPIWHGDGIDSDILDDFYFIAKSIDALTKPEREMLYHSYDLTYEGLKVLVRKHGFTDDKVITTKLIEIYTKQTESLEKENLNLSKQKLVNEKTDQLLFSRGSIPQTENTDKVLKYERSLQKSIYQNIIMLKKLQSPF